MTTIESKENTPMVSVWMITYNHEPYIAQAIEGVLMQKTDFPIELIIGEDCSTDNTAKIIKEYEAKYPKIIKARYNNQNLGMMPNMLKTLEECTGKYIALCEGDDYWTNPEKLQKQVDFLEENGDVTITHHRIQVIDELGEHKYLSNNALNKDITTIEDLAKGNYIYTSSCVFRNNKKIELPKWFVELHIGDYPMHMLNAQFGKIKYINEVLGTYRISNNSMWSKREDIYKIPKWLHMLNHLIGSFNDSVNLLLMEQQIRVFNDYKTILKTHNIYQIDNNINFFPVSYWYLLNKNYEQHQRVANPKILINNKLRLLKVYFQMLIIKLRGVS